MANSLQSEPVRDLLDRLFKAADEDDLRRSRIAERYPGGIGQLDPRERANAYAELYIPVSPEGRRLLYSLIRASPPSPLAEFGTSFGISTISPAAALPDNGPG